MRRTQCLGNDNPILRALLERMVFSDRACLRWFGLPKLRLWATECNDLRNERRVRRQLRQWPFSHPMPRCLLRPVPPSRQWDLELSAVLGQAHIGYAKPLRQRSHRLGPNLFVQFVACKPDEFYAVLGRQGCHLRKKGCFSINAIRSPVPCSRRSVSFSASSDDRYSLCPC